ncbi:mechanosensitive ion channel family protein [Fodinibius sp.]|uniref:mechanosensitive ion channel family protein n=1 Tax=Fodinibius sp. TaxID=1872440 RepID=UPI003566F442
MENIDGYMGAAWPFIFNAVFAIVILIIGWMIANWVNRKIRQKGKASEKLDDTLTGVFAKTAKVLVLVVVVLAVLDRFGVETTSLIAVIGALGLAIGLAWQGVLADFAAGIMILVMRPFKVGDAVDIDGTASGTIEEVGLVVTRLNTFDNVATFIPNSNIWGNTIQNLVVNENRRVDMVIGFGYDDDIDHAIQTISQVLAQDERVLDDPAPKIAVSELGGSSVDLIVRPWTKKDNYWDLKFDLTKRIKERFDEEGINFPYPSQDIYFHNESGE